MYHSHAWPLIIPACTRLHNTPCRFFFSIHLSCPPFRHHQAQGIIQRSSYPLFIAQIPFALLNAFSLHLHTRTRIVLHRAINPTTYVVCFSLYNCGQTPSVPCSVYMYIVYNSTNKICTYKISLSLSSLLSYGDGFFLSLCMYSIYCVCSDAHSPRAPSYTAGIK